jgi:hypothetical protein
VGSGLKSMLGRLRPAHNGLFWLTVLPPVALGLAGLTLWALHIPGGDEAAHAYKTALAARHTGFVWDNFWYGGSFGTITYGFVYYFVAQYLGGRVVVALAAGLLPLLFHVYFRRAFGLQSKRPAWALAAILVLYIVTWQNPYLLALALVFAGLVAVAYGRPAVGALLVGVSLFTNPVAIIAGFVLGFADFVAHPPARRRLLLFAGFVAPFVIVRAAFIVLFPEGGWYMRESIVALKAFAFAGLGFVVSAYSADPERRGKQVMFATYAAVCVLAYALPQNALGNNVVRLFYLVGVPLLLTIERPRLPRVVTTVAVIAVAVVQLASPFVYFQRTEDFRDSRAAFWTPALSFAAGVYSPDFRVHVLSTRAHWDAYYFPVNGFPITRGWFRQADALHARLFYGVYDAPEYIAWLREMGVQYVFLPHCPLDWTSAREPAILAGSRAFTVAFESSDWTVYRLRDASPLAVAAGGGRASVEAIDHSSVTVRVGQAGDCLVKVTWSPYWAASGGAGIARSADDFVVLRAPAAGVYHLRIEVTACKLLGRLF